jgi:ceramide glucosyltransferase
VWLAADLRYLILLPALAPLIYYCLATYAGESFFRAKRRSPSPVGSYSPPVSILKPVRGIDREAYENFSSMCELDYPEYEIVFAVAERDDPAVDLIRKLQQAFPNRAVRLIVGIEQLGSSRKTNSLCRLVKEAKYDLLVINDSDVRVEKDYLWDVVAPFRNRRVGVVTALFRSMTGKGFAADVDAIGVPTDAAAMTLVAWKFQRIDFALGWTMAITKERLAEIGGFEPLRDMHSDDFALGNQVAKKGYRVELTRKPVWMVFPSETLGEFLAHELRWSIQLRNLRPLGYLGMFLTFGFAWSLLVAAIVPSWKVAASYFLAYAALRLLVAWVIGVRGLGDPTVRRKPWLVIVRDALNLAVYIASFFSNTVEWRGRPYRLHGPFLEAKETAHGNALVRQV